MPQQKEELSLGIDGFRDVLSTKRGKLEGVVHRIDTGDATTKRRMPYRICPGANS